MVIRKLEPQPSAPRPATKPTPAVTPKPSAPTTDPKKVAIDAKTGRTSSFEAFRPPPVAIERHAHTDHRNPDACAEGRGKGTNDDSVGRGTNDDSVGRGTNDDSVGRGTNDDSVGRGTNDDSIGRGKGTNDDSIGRGTNDDSIGRVPPPPERGTGDQSVGGPSGAGAPTSLEPSKEPLPADAKAKVDALLHSRDPEVARQSAYVFSRPEFKALPAAQRAQIADVMVAGGRPAARAMAEMFEQSGGAMLQETGKDGKTVLENLERLTTAKDGGKVIGDVMYDLVIPGRIWQGRAPTCTVSTMQYELAQQDPGEYARLMTGLVVDGKVEMRGGGELKIDPDWAMRASEMRADRRSGSEAIFQAAAMDFANGDDTYLAYSQESIGKDGAIYRGLHGDQISEMLHQLMGVKYEVKQIGSDAEADAELNEILQRERPNRPVLFDITIEGSQSNHCVSLVDVRGDRVWFRDPTTGKTESMTKDEFRSSLAAVHYAPPTMFEGAGRMMSRFKNFIF